MKRSNRVLALFSLALSLAFAPGCIAPTDDADPDQIAEESQALLGDTGSSGAPTFEVTPLDDGGFRFVSVGVVDLPAGAVWSKIQNMEQLLPIAFQGSVADFEWVDGGNPGRVPSRFQFSINGATVLEEVFYRSHEEHALHYRLVTPALGILNYVGMIDIDQLDQTHSVITFTREIYFADPALVEPFSDLFQDEMVNLLAYFSRGSN